MAELDVEAGKGAGRSTSAVVASAPAPPSVSAPAPVSNPIEMSRSERVIVTIALLLAMTVTALEQTVVSTAMPSIIAALKGFDIYPWVFSAYLLAATVSTPLYGKLADLLGRKRVLLVGLGLFAAGSMLSGLARSMPELIAMRVLQGLGAGSVGPIVLTMLGDIFTLEERAKVQGWFSAVWGISSLAGPALGGILTDQLSWRWVFFVTVPFAVIAAWILIRHVHERLEHREVPPIDWAGATLLTLGSVVLLLAVLEGSHIAWGWELSLLIAAGVLLGSFLVWEKRAADPVLPLDLILSAHIGASIVGSFLIGGAPVRARYIHPAVRAGSSGGTATESGRMITPLFLSWAISVAVAAKVVVRLGFRRTAVVGSILIAMGTTVVALGDGLAECFGVDVQPGDGGDRPGHGSDLAQLHPGGAERGGLGPARSGDGCGRLLPHDGRSARCRYPGSDPGLDPLPPLSRFRGDRPINRRHRRPPARDAQAPDRAQLAVVRDALCRSLRDVFFQMVGLAVLAIVCSVGLRGGRAVSRMPHDGQQSWPGHSQDKDAEESEVALPLVAEL